MSSDVLILCGILLVSCSVRHRIICGLLLPSVLWHCWLGDRKGIQPIKIERCGAGMVICLERGADLHMAQQIPLPLTVSCFSKIQIGFTFLVPAYPGSPGQRAVKRVCVCRRCSMVCVSVCCTWSSAVHKWLNWSSCHLACWFTLTLATMCLMGFLAHWKALGLLAAQ